LSEDFVEQAHQDGIWDNSRTNLQKDRAVVAAIHSKWEYKRKLPSVLMKSEAVGRRSVRTMKTSNDADEMIVMPISEKDKKKKILGEQKEIL
jgi:predicted membrane-bound mannosyltransferase